MSHPTTTDDSREIVRVDAIVKDFTYRLKSK